MNFLKKIFTPNVQSPVQANEGSQISRAELSDIEMEIGLFMNNYVVQHKGYPNVDEEKAALRFIANKIGSDAATLIEKTINCQYSGLTKIDQHYVPRFQAHEYVLVEKKKQEEQRIETERLEREKRQDDSASAASDLIEQLNNGTPVHHHCAFLLAFDPYEEIHRPEQNSLKAFVEKYPTDFAEYFSETKNKGWALYMGLRTRYNWFANYDCRTWPDVARVK